MNKSGKDLKYHTFSSSLEDGLLILMLRRHNLSVKEYRDLQGRLSLQKQNFDYSKICEL